MRKLELEDYRAKRSKESPEFAKASAVSSLIASLIKLRINAGITQAELAQKLGVAQPRIAEFEKMDGRRVSLEFAVRYALEMGTTIALVSPKAGQRPQAALRVSERKKPYKSGPADN